MNRDEISAADADRSPPALGFTYGDKKTEMEDEYDVKADVKGGYDQDIPLQTLPAGEEATVKQSVVGEDRARFLVADQRPQGHADDRG